MNHSEGTYYRDYLQLSKLLDAQHPKSLETKLAHDEMLFIIIHQVYELWFKQILFELDAVLAVFKKPVINESELGDMVSKLERITEVQTLLLSQLRIMETMTPLDFLDFRSLLTPASGFQSVQFRLIEIRLGLKAKYRPQKLETMLSRFVPEDRAILQKAESEASVMELLESWLLRMPFLESDEFHFLRHYQLGVDRLLKSDEGMIQGNPHFSAEEKQRELKMFELTKQNFAALFDEGLFQQHLSSGGKRLSYRATLAALFIHLYRDEPILHLPFRILQGVTKMDELLTSWRSQHALMVHRMIGTKIGTGATSGYEYLRSMAEGSKIFIDLFDLPTYLIPRSYLPPLPESVKKKLGFVWS